MGHTDFSSTQLNQILSAGAFNSQVHSVLNDDDVKEFYKKIILGRESELNHDLLIALNSVFKD